MTFASHKSVNTTGKLSLLTLALMATPFAMAQDGGWYVGASIGQSNATIDDARITSGLLPGPKTVLSAPVQSGGSTPTQARVRPTAKLVWDCNMPSLML